MSRVAGLEGTTRASPAPVPAGGSAAKALGDLVAAIGGPAFPACLFDALHILAGVELCSVFMRDAGKPLELIFASGESPQVPGFTWRASHAYARDFWRSDRQLSLLARVPAGTPLVVRRRAADIADPAYRGACYDQAKVIERVSILSQGRPCLMVNGYRTAGKAPFGPQDIACLEFYAALLTAALRQHLRAGSSPLPLFDEAALTGRLCAPDCGLSAREAEVVAGLILGETQERIARAKRLSPATVITYRRRAYGKLGVSNRHDLMALHRKLATDAVRTGKGREGE